MPEIKGIGSNSWDDLSIRHLELMGDYSQCVIERDQLIKFIKK